MRKVSTIAYLVIMIFTAGSGALSWKEHARLDRIRAPSSLTADPCDQAQPSGTETPFGSTLSPLWAQELVGADLANMEMARNHGASLVLFGVPEKVNIASLDPKILAPNLLPCASTNASGICEKVDDYHSESVVNLVADSDVGSGRMARLSVTANGANDDSELIDSAQRMIENHVPLFCSSVGPEDDPERKAFQDMAKNGVVLLQASGNSYPATEETGVAVDGIITVASLSPIGLLSGFSSPGTGFTVAAPSDHVILSKSGGRYTLFGGTSGAQPLVCGAVSNVISLLPGITTKQVEALILKTAIPTANGREIPLNNSVGMINAYKLVRVAERLASSWPADAGKLDNAELYDFDEESSQKLASGLASLAAGKMECAIDQPYDDLRTAFLLRPRSSDARLALQKYYLSQKLSMQAHFIESLGGVDSAFLRAAAQTPNPDIQAAVARQAVSLGEPEASFLKALSIPANGDPELQATQSEVALYGLKELGKTDEATQLAIQLVSSKSYSSEYRGLLTAYLSFQAAFDERVLVRACIAGLGGGANSCVAMDNELNHPSGH